MFRTPNHRTAPLAATLGLAFLALTVSTASAGSEPPSGACCADGTCLLVPAAKCDGIPGGLYQGDGTICVPGICGGLDHFTSYKVAVTRQTPKFFPLGPVRLTDQFRTNDYAIVKPTVLAVPADKNLEGIIDPDTHLVEYKLKPVKGSPKFEKLTGVRITNQCNDLLLQVSKPASILVPSAKDLANPVAPPDPLAHEVDHFLCYKASAQKRLADGTRLPKFPKGIQVEVSDQLQNRRYELAKITKLCNPVDKSGSPALLGGPDRGAPVTLEPATIRHPDRHLVCYRAKLATYLIAQDGCGPLDPEDKGTKIDPKQEKHDKRTGIHVANQLGALQLDTKTALEICIPSTKLAPM